MEKIEVFFISGRAKIEEIFMFLVRNNGAMAPMSPLTTPLASLRNFRGIWAIKVRFEFESWIINNGLIFCEPTTKLIK